jgi:hypothetical protein
MIRTEVTDVTCLATHNGLVAQIRALATTRNDLIHGPWFDIPGTNIDQAKSKLAKRQFLLGELHAITARGVTPAQVAGAVKEAHEVTKALISHLAKVRSALPKKPKG